MTQLQFEKGSRLETSRRLLASAGIAVILAGGGVLATENERARHQDQLAIRSSSPQPDSSSVSPDARRSYAAFWKKLPKSEADAFERDLNALETRQKRGEAIDPEVEKLRREQPKFFQMSSSLEAARWVASSGSGGVQAATYRCIGLSWIGRNGRLRCLGKLVASHS